MTFECRASNSAIFTAGDTNTIISGGDDRACRVIFFSFSYFFQFNFLNEKGLGFT